MRKVCFLIVLGSLLVLLSVGCNSAGKTSGIDPNTEEKIIPAQKTIPPSPPYTIEIAFPEGAPSLNEEAVLTCTVKTIIQLTNMHIEVKLPEFLEPVNHELTWSGDVQAGDELTVINADITANGIGTGVILLGHSTTPDSQITRHVASIYVSVFDESARWEKYQIWSEGCGPLGVHISGDPLIYANMYMSLSRLPRLYETTELLCTIAPRQDYQDIKAEIVLPEGATLVDGNLEWQGDLKADTPVHFLAKIRFDLIGDWRIDAGLWRWFNGEYSWKVTTSKYITVGFNDSEYWFPTISPDENLPPPPATWIETPN